jgi:hypothetical protein
LKTICCRFLCSATAVLTSIFAFHSMAQANMAAYPEERPSIGAPAKHSKKAGANAGVSGGLRCALGKILSVASTSAFHAARDKGMNFDGRDVSVILRRSDVPFPGVDMNSSQFENIESMGFRKVGNSFDSGPPGSLVLYSNSPMDDVVIKASSLSIYPGFNRPPLPKKFAIYGVYVPNDDTIAKMGCP